MSSTIDRLGAALLAVALLLPVGDAPWFSFWREWTACVASLLIVLGSLSLLRDRERPLVMPLGSLPALAFGLVALCWIQFALGLFPYHSDALLAALYLGAFASCAAVVASLPMPERDAVADRLAIALLAAALVSVPLGALQWVGWLRLDMEIPVAGGRPVAHMEQANLFCSLLIQGLCGAWRLAARHRIGVRTAVMLGIPMLLTIVLTQSRVAWMVTALLLCVAAWRRDLVDWRRYRSLLLGIVAVVALGAPLLPWLDTSIGLTGAALSERVSVGRRPAAWSLFVDAALTRPWTGWGVLQNGTAQFELADRHPALGYIFSSAHNVVLDLMIWFGIPIGLAAGLALVSALLLRLARASSGAALATSAAAAALFIHGLVELPLHYAYFLLPLGLLLGATSEVQSDARPMLALRMSTHGRGLMPLVSLACAAALALLGSEYIRITNVRPVFALDQQTKHPTLEAELPVPNVWLLDQLREFHAFALLPLTSGVAESDLDAAKTAMRRAPYSSAIERYVLLAGLNGRDSDAADALRRVCKFETARQCERSRYAWMIWRQRWPGLPADLVPLRTD